MRSAPSSTVPSLRTGTGSRFVALVFLLIVSLLPSPSAANEKRGIVTVSVKLNAPENAARVRLWIPRPMSNDHQRIRDVEVAGNYASTGMYRDGASGEGILFAEWEGPAVSRTLTYSFEVVRREAVTREFSGREVPLSREAFEPYLAPTSRGPTDGAVKELADRITAGRASVLAKADAVYGWIVENMHRDPAVKGCGLGEVETLLGTLGGKCADISSVFVALARSAGVPAREIFGIRLPAGQEGDITRWQHCWAQFYLPGSGWIVVDPADVRKAILEKKIAPEEAKPLREYYFGAVDERRVEFGTGRDVRLVPPQAGEPLNYFMYPYAEADGRPLNEDLYGFNIGYTISFREM